MLCFSTAFIVHTYICLYAFMEDYYNLNYFETSSDNVKSLIVCFL